MVDDVEGIFYRLLVEHVGEGYVAILVGKVQTRHCPPVNTDLRGDEAHGDFLTKRLVAHGAADKLVELLNIASDGVLVGIVATGVSHLVLQLHNLLAVADLASGRQTIEQRELQLLDAVASHDGGKDVDDAA